MDAHVLFWTAAELNMLAMLVLMGLGVRSVRRGDVSRHRRLMLSAACLVLLFLASYTGKVFWIGHEELGRWSDADRRVLYFHETCVALMMLFGIGAIFQAWRLRGSRSVTRQASDPQASAGLLRWHRLLGRGAGVAALLGALSAGLMLLGMYRRAGLL